MYSKPFSWVFRENTLDAIRLFAAAQVAIVHSWKYLSPSSMDSWFFQFLGLFPGVPIFFFVSGFLISKSYQSSPNIREYSKNRILRLYPALIICVLVNLVMVGMAGYVGFEEASVGEIFLLFAAKATFFQFYNPDFMRGFGDGVLNGSLWTICVELQFYIAYPLICAMLGNNRKVSGRILLTLILCFVFANWLLFELRHNYSESFWWKLYRVSFVPWIYMFLVGVWAQQNFDKIGRLIHNLPTLFFVAFYIVSAHVLVEYAGFSIGNEISPILFLLVAVTVLRVAYSAPQRVNETMKGNDISYGLYIWHMPIVNQLLYLEYESSGLTALLALIASLMLAAASWFLLEKPSLQLKSYSLNSRLRR
jgi:peptidoglycan/LPS O-acetylase OafA/YrhL